jgi:hypothetical protein
MLHVAMRLISVPLLAMLLVACQLGPTNRPVPSVNQIGSDIKCDSGDHAFEDAQAGWGFCYPGTWKYNERANQSSSPSGLDLTFDITDVPCTSPSPVPGSSASPVPVCSANAGLFAFMIISTYDRGDASSLAGWVAANLTPVPPSQAPGKSPGPSPSPLELTPISWGNATEAGRLSDGRRVALTPHHVVILDLRAGFGNLDLEGAMSARLGTWKFLF